jgi:CheY-like chemotaxis protein
MGRGLTIVRHLVELHGGTVCADNVQDGRRAVLTVCLPLMPVTPQATDEERAHPAAENGVAMPTTERLDGVRVLAVDDERGACDAIAAILETAGVEVCTEFSGADALNVLTQRRADVHISDIGMPAMDGYEFIRALRDRPAEQGGRILAIALTAYARLEDRRRTLSAGFQTHVAKPIDPAELVAVIASILRR